MDHRRLEVHFQRLDVDPERVLQLEGLLTSDERNRVERLVTEASRRRATVRLACRRQLLAEHLCVAPHDVVLVADERGRPHVSTRTATPLEVSFSSSDDVAVVALAASKVGVDVEARTSLRDHERLAERVATPQERASLLALPAAAREHALLRLWTRKEAYLKATGEGIGDRLTRSELGLEDAGDGRVVRPANAEPWLLYDVTCPWGSLVASVVVALDGDGVRPSLSVHAP